jgi:hypothetical protein
MIFKPSYAVFTGVIILCLVAVFAPVAAGQTVFAISSSPAGATVCVDTYHCGITPASFTEDPYTWHSITVSMEGYQVWGRYENTGSAGTTAIIADLVPNPPSSGWLELSPSGADVYVDTVYHGNREQTIPLSPGVHTIRLQKPGYYDYPEQITITAGQTYSDSPVQKPYLQSDGYGDLRVQSIPPGATVRVRNNYMGTTYSGDPVYVTQLPPGTYTVTLSMPDYQPFTEDAVVRAGIIHDITATMVPVAPGPAPDSTGQIRVGSIPAGAMIYLDNGLKGVTPTVLADIPAGSHSLVLRLNGHQDWTSEVKVAGGNYTEISGNLTRIPATPKSTPLPTKSGLPDLIALAGVGICGTFVLLKKKE